MHGTTSTEFKDKKEVDKLMHVKYIADRYLLDIDTNKVQNHPEVQQYQEKVAEHIAVRLYKHHCDKRFSHSIKLSRNPTLSEVIDLTTSFDSQLDYERTKADRG